MYGNHPIPGDGAARRCLLVPLQRRQHGQRARGLRVVLPGRILEIGPEQVIVGVVVNYLSNHPGSGVHGMEYGTTVPERAHQSG